MKLEGKYKIAQLLNCKSYIPIANLCDELNQIFKDDYLEISVQEIDSKTKDNGSIDFLSLQISLIYFYIESDMIDGRSSDCVIIGKTYLNNIKDDVFDLSEMKIITPNGFNIKSRIDKIREYFEDNYKIN